MAPTLVQQIWLKLDEVMSEAMNWNGGGKILNREKAIEKLGPWYSSEDELNWLNDKVEYVGKTSVGRGLAEALVIICTPAFENSDQVVRLAVKRYKAKVAGEELPDTPGFMGPGQTGDSLRLAGQGTEANVQSGVAPSVSTETPSPTPAPTQPGPKKKKSKLNETAIASIKKGLANGFDAETFAEMYNVSIDEIKALA
ncbi:hypothetical protein SEA_GIBBLES_72 [Gordonia phage Gibbles]|uniref:Uncharacterized protein n=3 Tax=Gordonia phage Orchid TaxID=1838075 RepID=A0A160DH71_9CAUD|nr:hypothetical protein BH761_gp074 [Gordonia phage Orchid]ANA87309.1 hypothetical protein PBI_PATRICKSTAR_75 [Gordonia phage PatrickStar]ANA87421.1 hypothetical protein PBI_ORCHID_74 [Gordonia phage Orchid]ANA87536.1 hypothetical protein PBI_KAMPE_75 [Gordonia phage Kampe]QDK02031.1 hypothetical protein SEA_GIBBLES_72 [Gordonia phage Gibbles]